MADDFWSSLLNNPNAINAGIAGLGTLLDPTQAQTTTTQQQTSLPSYIAPYVGRMLGRAESLSQEGYTPYGGQRLAEFTPAQQQAFQNYAGAQVPGNIGEGGNIAQQAAQKLLGSQYTAPEWDTGAAQRYMSPYQQGVTDVAKREAVRDYQSNILPGIAGAAAQRGAFGGSRQAILESEAGRNLGQRLSDIQTQGLHGAYTTGQQQFTADQQRALQAQQLGLSALQSAPGAAATTANIGQTQLNAQNAINQNLLGVGALQQQQQQKGLDIGYQDFLNQRQQPYQQAQYMQSFLSGLPMTQYATANTTPAPSLTQQLVGNTMAGYYGIGSLGKP
jgi:hypothetical protein